MLSGRVPIRSAPESPPISSTLKRPCSAFDFCPLPKTLATKSRCVFTNELAQISAPATTNTSTASRMLVASRWLRSSIIGCASR
jgi:hypothetical protein